MYGTQGTFGKAGRAGHPRQEPPGSFIRHNALIGLHSHPVKHAAPAPAPASQDHTVSAPYIAPAPAAAFGAPGAPTKPFPGVGNVTRNAIPRLTRPAAAAQDSLHDVLIRVLSCQDRVLLVM